MSIDHSDVAFFIPNLIGYTRFILLFVSPYFVLSEDQWHWFVICYSASYLLDAVDGNAARYFDQCSRFGAALDMVCDRASNATIYMALGTLYPSFSILFFACFVLDFGSHWLQFQSSACMKAGSHKGKNKKENWLVGLYYNNDTVFKITVPGAELCSVLLFVQAHMTSL